MKIMEEAEAGSVNEGDCVVKIREGSGKIEVKGGKNVKHVEEILRERLIELEAEADVEVENHGADDFVIIGRFEAAISRAIREDVGGKKARRGITSRDRIRRSLLLVPGNEPISIKKILGYGDCVMFDLQCSGMEKKHETRYLVKNALQRMDFGNSELWVKIDRETAREDISIISYGNPHGICIPRVENVEDIEVVEHIMAEANLDSHLMPLIETPKGVANAGKIVEASDKVVAIAFEGEEFLKLMGGKRTWDALLFPRSIIIISARSAGIQAIDGIYPVEGERKEFMEEVKKIVEMGYDGKFVGNLKQMKVLHKFFAPEEKDVEMAKKILAAVDSWGGEGKPYIGGKIIDDEMERRARRLIKLAELYK